VIDWRWVITRAGSVTLFLAGVFYVGGSWALVNRLISPPCYPNEPLKGDWLDPQVVWIENQAGLKLEVWIYPSRNGAVVIALGGSGGAARQPVNFLLEEGYGIVEIRERSCSRPPGKVTLGFQEASDAEAIMQYIMHNIDVNPNKIGALGFSMQGAAAIQFAAQNPNVRAVIAEGGYGNLGRMFSEAGDGRLAQPFLWGMQAWFQALTGVDPWQSSPVDVIGEISPNAVFLIYGEHEVHGAHPWEQYEAAGEPKQIWIVPGGSHGRNYALDPEGYRARVLAFFEKFLLGAGE